MVCVGEVGKGTGRGYAEFQREFRGAALVGGDVPRAVGKSLWRG
jgi:hypothetical protein